MRAVSATELQCLSWSARRLGVALPAAMAGFEVESHFEMWQKLQDVPSDLEPDDYINPELAAAMDRKQREQIEEIVAVLLGLGLTSPHLSILPSILDEKRLRRWIADVERTIVPAYLEIFGESIQDAIGTVTGRVGFGFDLENRRVQTYIREASRRMAADTTRTLTAVLAEELTAGIEQGDTTDDLAKRIMRSGKVEATKARAMRIARTETAFTTIKAEEEGMRQSGVIYGWKYVLSARPCAICVAANEALGGRVIKLGQSAFDVGTLLEIEGKAKPVVLDYEPVPGFGLVIPPTHPNCQCGRRYVRFDEVER